jgi:competence protein ComEC
VPLAALALLLWAGAERPPVLVAESGGLIGVMTPEGRALSKPKGDGFAAQSWLENDGDAMAQEVAHTRKAFEVLGRQRMATLDGAVILHATGKAASAKALAACGTVAMVIVNVAADPPEGCRLYDIRRLRDTGALAVYPGPDGLRVVSAREKSGRRLWSP